MQKEPKIGSPKGSLKIKKKASYREENIGCKKKSQQIFT